ncbi:MAG: zinc-dependent alcohol dehydrogenase [Bacteroidota bacterium]
MKAAVLTQYKNIEWKEVSTPELTQDNVLVRVSHASICGSDQHVFLGEFHPRTSVPLIMGHEFSGVVEETGDNVTDIGVGQKVVVDPIIWCGTCPACKIGHYPACTSLKLVGIDLDGGFGEYVSVPASMIYKIDEKTDLKHAALVEVLSIGFHACARAGVKSDDTVVIWGAGKVGQCILQAARTKTKNKIIMVDIVDERLKFAGDAYPDIEVVNARSTDPLIKIKEITNGEGSDIAFEAVGHAQLQPGMVHPVRGCIQAIRGAGKVCVLGLADDPAPIVMKELIWKEGSLITSRVSHGEFNETIEQLEAGNLKPEKLITGVLPASEAQKGFDLLEKDPAHNLKILLDLA